MYTNGNAGVLCHNPIDSIGNLVPSKSAMVRVFGGGGGTFSYKETFMDPLRMTLYENEILQ